MAGKGGGAWKVAYADFVTAMMAFFLVMWITAQNKPVRDAVAGHFRDPYGTSRAPGGTSLLPSRDDTGRSPVSGPHMGGLGRGKGARGTPKPHPQGASEEEPDAVYANKPMLRTSQEGSTTRVGTIVTFADDSAALDDRAKQRLDELVPELRGKPNKIEIRGHSSRRPLPAGSPFGSAWELSYARCLATMKRLEEQGIEPERIRLSQGGAFEPHAPHDVSQAQDSRVEVYVLGEFADRFLGTAGEAHHAPAAEPPAH